MESLNAGRFAGKVILIGGELNPQQQSLSGVAGERMMKQFSVDKAFLSVGGVTLERGISDYDINESSMSTAFAEAAGEVIVLADESKMGKDAFVTIMPIEPVHIIVSSSPPPEDWLSYLQNCRTKWIEA
ncbi:Glycerol-3-phosphate regulon repressor [compost metagenome]